MNTKLNLFLLIIAIIFFNSAALADNNKPLFTKAAIEKLSDSYVHNNLNIKDPAFVDVDKDGDFDILYFNKGNVEYYKNTGTLEQPVFVLENKHYDKYNVPAILNGLPMPVFFADKDGDGDLDMFAVKEKGYDKDTKKNEYRVLYSENALDLDTGTLITIILVLVIVVLVIAILGK
ncbi:MAG: VCBS repeat-containing protein [Ignavibacteriae bacterium]|nr:MAG: VCBS repeat-containing protein [Ignavibacteriota bacterium]